MQETIYLTVSPDIHEVLPNLPIGKAPRMNIITNKNILSFAPPFPWLVYPSNGYTYKYLDSLKNLGVNDLNVIIKNYQQAGFDHENPDGLDTSGECNKFTFWYDGDCNQIQDAGLGGNATLQMLKNLVVDTLQYGFALHEQYVDYYTNSKTYIDHGLSYAAIYSNGNPALNWINGCHDTARVIKPSLAPSIASDWSSRLGNLFHPTWSYLDVHSGVNPSDMVDYEPSQTGAGLFRYVVAQYRDVANTIRTNYDGPVQGEGGNHFLYAGYMDDFEARLMTGDYRVFGYNAPLFVDFDIYKFHNKSALHGVGHYSIFFSHLEKNSEGVDISIPAENIGRDSMLTLIATELAFGHGGLVTKACVVDNSMEQAIIEYQYVLPVYKKIANLNLNPTNTEILYSDNGGTHWQTASEYIRDHPHWDNSKDSSDFMSQVKVRYPGGITIIVNRHPTRSLDVPSPGRRNSWYAYHANGSLGTGRVNVDSFALPPMNGWVVCDSSMNGNPDQPLLLSPDNGAKNISGPTVLRWEVSERATRYTIHIRTTNGDIEVTTPVTWYTIGNLSPGSVVIWSVTAINDGGKSIPSMPRSFITIPDYSPH